MPYAVAADVLTRWIGSTPPATALVDLLIDDASVKIRYEFPDIDARIDPSPPVPGAVKAEIVKLVVIQVVTRFLRNPDNVKMVGAGPFSKTYADDAPAPLALTEEERLMLSGIPGKAGRRGFTIDPTPAPATPAWIGGGDWSDVDPDLGPGWGTW